MCYLVSIKLLYIVECSMTSSSGIIFSGEQLAIASWNDLKPDESNIFHNNGDNI